MRIGGQQRRDGRHDEDLQRKQQGLAPLAL